MSRNGDWCLATTAKFRILQIQFFSVRKYCGQLTHNSSVYFIKSPTVVNNLFFM